MYGFLFTQHTHTQHGGEGTNKHSSPTTHTHTRHTTHTHTEGHAQEVHSRRGIPDLGSQRRALLILLLLAAPTGLHSVAGLALRCVAFSSPFCGLLSRILSPGVLSLSLSALLTGSCGCGR
uniref:Uncharacterized protein n=1 Tax=Anopheles darlingi TaxID=43151 RepID=A0A2M4CX72_ANODA